MFPDTANFTDPAYSSLPWDQNYDPFAVDPTAGDIPNLPSGLPSSAPPLGTQNQGPAAPVSAQPGSSLLGWLGLATNVANTAISATRGYPVTKRPGTNTFTQSVMSTGYATLGVIVLIFIGVIFVLRKA